MYDCFARAYKSVVTHAEEAMHDQSLKSAYIRVDSANEINPALTVHIDGGGSS